MNAKNSFSSPPPPIHHGAESHVANMHWTSRRGRAVVLLLVLTGVAYYSLAQWKTSLPLIPIAAAPAGDFLAADSIPGSSVLEGNSRGGQGQGAAGEDSATGPVQSRVIDDLQHQQQMTAPGTLVPLEAHIISKCPDTRDALQELLLPVMERVSDKVDFKLSFIGKPTASDGVDCKHGPSECMGNIIELCARELYPDPKISLGFVMCLTRDYKHIPERSLIEDCALEHAIDFDTLNECVTRDDGAHGMGILRASVERTAEVSVTKSCTIRLDNEIYCIRDDGEWIDCPHGPGVNDLIIAIERLYHRPSGF